MLTTPESDRPDARDAAQPSRSARPAWLSRRWVNTGWLRSRWAGWVVFAAAAVVLFAAYLAQARTVAATSESGGQALQAWDILHGNLLLRGWTLSDVSFYTTELPEYMLVELLRGLNGDTVHLAAALSYTLMVLLGGLLAKGRATGREGLVRLLVGAGIMLAPALTSTVLVLSAPDHLGTQVPLLFIFLLLDRMPARWWAPVVVTILLTWAQVGDMIVLFEGALPLAAACALRMYRRRGPLSGQWYDLSLAVGALISAVAAKLVLASIRSHGGFFSKAPIAHFATAAKVSGNFWPDVQNVLSTFGANFLGVPFGRAAIPPLIHLVGLALVAWALAVAIRRLYVQEDLVVQALTISFLVVLVAYMFGTKQDPNETLGLLPIGAVLAGRLLGGRLLRDGLVPALAVVLVIYAGILGYNASKPPPVDPNRAVTAWLRAHHLSYGLAGFWHASIITVESAGHVQVRPARTYRGRLVTTLLESDASWYNPHLHDASFVIAAHWKACNGTCLPAGDLTKTFGPPAAVYRVDNFRILVWHKNLLSHLRIMYWCNGWPWENPAKSSPVSCEPRARPGAAGS
jgi:hypothetical protein